MSVLQFEAALLSDIGRKRKQNQDSGLLRPDLGLFIVADGMGGHQGGERASQLAVQTLEQELETAIPRDADALERAALKANEAIHRLSLAEPTLKGMGTTLTALLVSGHQAHFVQVGDSRAYFFRDGALWQLTRDHSLVQEKLRAGLIKRSELKSDQAKNVITRSIGYEAQVRVDRYSFELAAGDGFLLCSDGLSGPVDDSKLIEILDEMAKSAVPLEERVLRLIREANDQGGDDNITALIVQF